MSKRHREVLARTRTRWASAQWGKIIERAIQGSIEKGLLTEPLALEDIYYPSTPEHLSRG